MEVMHLMIPFYTPAGELVLKDQHNLVLTTWFKLIQISQVLPQRHPLPKPVFEEPDKIGGFVCFFWILLAFLLISQLN